MLRVKIGCSVLFLIVTVAVSYTYFTNSFFPAIQLAFLTIGISGVYLAYNVTSSPETHLSLTAIISTTTTLGWFIYVFPASFIGFDPDLFAAWAKLIIQSGAINGIESGFYRNAPAGLLLPAIASILTDTPIRTGFGIYSILFGILIPLLAISFASYIHTFTPQTVIGVSTLAAVMALPIKLGYLPIAQNLSILLVQITLLTLVIPINRPIDRNLLIIILIVALSFTHKIPLILLLIVLGIFLIYNVVQPQLLGICDLFSIRGQSRQLVLTVINLTMVIIWTTIAWHFTSLTIVAAGLVVGIGLSLIYIIEWNSFSFPNASVSPHTTNYLFLTAFVGLLLLTQWVYQTTFIRTIYLNYFTSGRNVSARSVNVESAIQADPGILDPFFHQSHTLILILAAALVFTWLIESDHANVRILLAAAGTIFLLSPLAITVQTSIGIGATRLIPNFISVLAAFVAVGTLGVPQLTNVKRVATIVVVVFVIFQAFSVIIVPGYPGTHRLYLHQNEIDAKSFANKYTNGEITTDYWYATEQVTPLSGTDSDFDTTFNAETEGYTGGTLARDGHKYILYRTDVDIYRFNTPGNWKLTWEPEEGLNIFYSKPYSSGGVNFYWRVS